MSDPLETAILAGAVRALRKRAAVQRAAAVAGTIAAGNKYPHVTLMTPEGASAAHLADGLERIAAELEVGGSI